jgi:hypothetical protein
LSPVCAGLKRDGAWCTQSVRPGEEWCYNHDPGRAEERRRAASKAGQSKPSREIRDLKKQLTGLARDVLEGRVERGTAAVVNQILNSRARLIELERKIAEQEQILGRIERLEQQEGMIYGR